MPLQLGLAALAERTVKRILLEKLAALEGRRPAFSRKERGGAAVSQAGRQACPIKMTESVVSGVGPLRPAQAALGCLGPGPHWSASHSLNPSCIKQKRGVRAKRSVVLPARTAVRILSAARSQRAFPETPFPVAPRRGADDRARLHNFHQSSGRTEIKRMAFRYAGGNLVRQCRNPEKQVSWGARKSHSPTCCSSIRHRVCRPGRQICSAVQGSRAADMPAWRACRAPAAPGLALRTAASAPTPRPEPPLRAPPPS